jgi:hypothetical protein
MLARSLAPAILLAACASTALAQAQYVQLPSVPYDGNADGSIVVGSGNGGTFRWVRSGGTATWTLLPEGRGGTIRCSSDGNYVVHSVLNGDDASLINGMSPTNEIAARWNVFSNTNQRLGVFANNPGVGTPNPPGVLNFAKGMSRNGTYISGVGYHNASNFRAFIWSTADGMLDLGSIGTQGSWGECVSDDGLVVAGRDRNPQTGTDRPTVWRRAAVGQPFTQTVLFTTGNLGTDMGVINGCSSDGAQLFGTSQQFPTQLVRWTWDGAQYNPASISSGFTVRPAAIPSTWNVTRCIVGGCSADGSVVVGSFTYQQPNNFFNSATRAFVWTQATGAYDLTTAAAATLPSGTTIGNAIGVSANGSAVFVGGVGSANGVVYLNNTGPGCVQPVLNPAAPSTSQISRCIGTAFLNVSVAGTPPFTFQWRKNGNPISPGPTGNGSNYVYSSAGAQQLQITSVKVADAGVYDCIVTNGCGSVTSAPITLTQYPVQPNDTCLTATPAGYGTYAFDSCGAFIDDATAGCASASVGDVWYSFVSSFDGDVRISTCGLTPLNTVITVYDSCGGSIIACNNDYCGTSGTQSTIDRVPVLTNQPILVRVAMAASSITGGTASIDFGLTNAAPPGDKCSSPVAVAEGSFNFDSSDAGTDGTTTCATNSGRDLWFSYIPSQNGTADFTTCGSLFDTVLSVHSGCGGTVLACNDDAVEIGCINASAIRGFAVTRNQPVLIRVAGKTIGLGGAGQLNITLAATSNCVADYNSDGFQNLDDLGDMITDYYAVPAIPGGAQANAPTYAGTVVGFGVPCPNAGDAPSPYAANAYRANGYRVGYSSDNSNSCPLSPDQAFPNLDNLGDYITFFYSVPQGPC